MQIQLYTVLIAVFVHVPITVVYGVGVDEAINGTIQGIEGGFITLTCDLRDINPDYIWFNNFNYDFLTMGDSTTNLTQDLRDRLSVNCSAPSEACYLTISSLKRSDAGLYGCGYQIKNGNKIVVSSGNLDVLVPLPPTDFSPECILYDENRLQVSSNMIKVGNQVELSCVTTGGDPNPSIYIARDGEAITEEVMGSTIEDYTLSQEDEGSTFTCVMTHSALSQPRTCSFLTLVDRTLTTDDDESTDPSTSNFVDEGHSLKPTSTYEKSTISKPLTTLSISLDSSQPVYTLLIALIVVAIVILLLFIICFIMYVLTWRKRASQDSSQGQGIQNIGSNNHTDLYLELNSDRERHEYEKLKTNAGETTDAKMAANNDDYAYANPSGDYEVAAVSDDEYETVEQGLRNLKQLAGVAYVNLQRPVKAQNVNVPKTSEKMFS